MAKDKKEQPKINFDGKDYEFDEFNDEQKMWIAHINDIQKKLNTNAFVADQLNTGKAAYVEKLRESLK
ncbi:MAG: hypothetical protein CMC15_16380 [Flavobacteriaceae bacterium]|nr:hypothetical protein [Flavobacteriaceae bacterium]|tara:strand:+ start:818 stop:1021 length:204 start_codon:yes stop_codon:yes gene_type:complete